MTGANNAARSDNPDPQFLIILLRHASSALSILRNRRSLTRDKFDRAAHLPFKIHLTGASVRGSLRASLGSHYVKDLQYYTIKSDAGERHSPAWSGQEKGRRGTSHHEECAARFRA